MAKRNPRVRSLRYKAETYRTVTAGGTSRFVGAAPGARRRHLAHAARLADAMRAGTRHNVSVDRARAARGYKPTARARKASMTARVAHSHIRRAYPTKGARLQALKRSLFAIDGLERSLKTRHRSQQITHELSHGRAKSVRRFVSRLHPRGTNGRFIRK